MNSRFVIAAASSGSGKTTLTLGLLRCLRNKGLSVASFKCGPDYIDPLWHRQASACQSVNLDTFLASESHVKQLFARFSCNKSVCVIEGVMGLFDGYRKLDGSTAHIARLIDAPVVLLVNAASTAYSVAATIFGFKNFCPDVRLAGVIFNRVASPSHFSFLKEACADAGVPCLGYISKLPHMEMPSRYLGLTIESCHSMERFINMAAEAVDSGVDIDALLEATQCRPPQCFRAAPPVGAEKIKIKVAVARDEAFNFIYPANLLALTEHPRYDVELDFFSPLTARRLPSCDLLYLPGGYPELYAPTLEANLSMRQSVRDFAENHGRILAECGGMMYLTQRIDHCAMCGVLPLAATMDNSRLTLGYRTLRIGSSLWRGHEFHYSKIIEPHALPSIARQHNARGIEVDTPVYRYKNLIAGYTHLYWGDKDIFELWQI